MSSISSSSVANSTMTEEQSLLEALAQVDKLEELAVTMAEMSASADQPSIEAMPCSIVYETNFDTNFEDRNGFITGIAKYIEEATVHAALNELLLEGEEHAITLYTWRCCSRGMPQPKSDNDPHRIEIYEKTVEVLTPQVDKLFRLMKFQKVAIERFCCEVKTLCHPEKRKQFVSEAYLLTLGKFINIFAILDELKNIKSSVKNDFSTYKRAAQFLKVMKDMQSLQESQNLSLFLATQNKIRNNLKENLEKIPGYEEILCEVINICVEMFEARMYLFPTEKHMLVKVIGFCLDLIDNEKWNIYKLDHKKKLKLERIDKIFKAVQVVPLYGDMQISPFQYVKRSKNFDHSKWPLCSSTGNTSCPVDLVKILPHIKQDHLKYISELQECSNSTANSAGQEDAKDSEKICRLAMKGLRLLSEWASAVAELYSWKLLNPTDHHQNRDCPPEAEEYERATRYNYTAEEKSALVIVISLIKGLQYTLFKQESFLNEHIRKHIYTQLQTFVQLTLREPLRKASKNKKDVLRSVLLAIRHTSGDYMKSSQAAQQDPILKGEKGLNYESRYVIGQRSVGPSSTQLYLLRTMLESLLSNKTCANRSLRKDMESKSNYIPTIEAFFSKTFFWGYLQNLGGALWKICDLSQMWYREFYLELTMGKRIQFPIEMSMPWILIEHVLENPSMMEYALYPLDLYNDSCYCALSVFKKQFLYHELEAEVNLCFDMFVYKLGEQIFSYHKKLAALSLLDKRFQKESKLREGPDSIPTLKHYRFECLMRQRRVQLFGHSIDLAKLIVQRVHKDILKSLEVALRRFQGGDLTGVIQLESLISVNRETHRLLHKHFPDLDSFEMLWKQANHEVLAPHGKSTIHIFYELSRDFLTNYCYNSTTNRFVRCSGFTFSPQKGNDHRQSLPKSIAPMFQWGSKSLNTAFAAIHARYEGFIGEPHFRAMVKLLGYNGIAVILQEILKIIRETLKGTEEFIQGLADSMPGKSVPPCDEGSPGILAFYLEHLNDILQHPDVKIKLFQSFRVFGNAILFCLQVEKILSQEENWMLLHAAPLQSIFPKPQKTDSEDEEDLQKRVSQIEKDFAKINVLKNIEMFGTVNQRNLTKETHVLSKERMCCGLSIFQGILEKVKGFIDEMKMWREQPENQVMNMDEGKEFYRIWSALQFGFCIPTGPNEVSVEQLYSDSFIWGGCAIISLLGQQKRFELFDFCHKLQDAQRTDGKDCNVKGIPLGKMATRIRCFQQLNFQIFSILRKYTQPEIPPRSSLEHVRCFPAPIHKTLLNEMLLNKSKDSKDDSSDNSSSKDKIGEGDQASPASAQVREGQGQTERLSVLYQKEALDSPIYEGLNFDIESVSSIEGSREGGGGTQDGHVGGGGNGEEGKEDQ